MSKEAISAYRIWQLKNRFNAQKGEDYFYAGFKAGQGAQRENEPVSEEMVLKAIYESGIHQYIPAVMHDKVKDGIGINVPSQYLVNFSKKLIQQPGETERK